MEGTLPRTPTDSSQIRATLRQKPTVTKRSQQERERGERRHRGPNNQHTDTHETSYTSTLCPQWNNNTSVTSWPTRRQPQKLEALQISAWESSQSLHAIILPSTYSYLLFVLAAAEVHSVVQHRYGYQDGQAAHDPDVSGYVLTTPDHDADGSRQAPKYPHEEHKYAVPFVVRGTRRKGSSAMIPQRPR